MPRKPKEKPGGRWMFVPDEELTEEQKQDNLEADMDEVTKMLTAFRDPDYPFAAVEEFQDYFPGKNEVPKNGSWILVKKQPDTEYTVPPLSIWFATPWPVKDHGGRFKPHRIKIVTPKGDLGLWPHEYALVDNPGKYFEFIGTDMQARFFGNEKGIPADKLFYIRSRGVSKKDAIIMLIGSVMAHGVLWLETAQHICEQIGYPWPDKRFLATNASDPVPTDGERPEPAEPGSGAERGTGDPVPAGAGESLHEPHEQLEWGMGKPAPGSGGTAGAVEVHPKARSRKR